MYTMLVWAVWWLAGRDKPRRARHVRVLSHEPDIAIVRVPPQHVVKPKRGFINVRLAELG